MAIFFVIVCLGFAISAEAKAAYVAASIVEIGPVFTLWRAENEAYSAGLQRSASNLALKVN